MPETLRERAIAMHQQHRSEQDNMDAERAAENMRRREESLREAVRVALSLPIAIVNDAPVVIVGDDMQLQVEGLMFTHSAHGTWMVNLVLSPCERCGIGRLATGIGSLRELGSVLAKNGEGWTQHCCPSEPEYWLINREVREAEIAAAAERRQANEALKADRLQTVLSALVGAGVSQNAIADMLSGFMAIATGLAQRECDERGN